MDATRVVVTWDEREVAFGGQAMVRRACVSSMLSGESQLLVNRLRWHIQQALRHDDASAVLVLHPLARAASQGRRAVTFGPVAARLRGLIRADDVLEVDAADGIGIVLRGTGAEGARAVFMRLSDVLCSSISPRTADEVAVPVAFGYAASTACAGGTAMREATGDPVHVEADSALASRVEAISTAMLQAGWGPQTALTLTLPVPNRGARCGARRTRGRYEQYEQYVEGMAAPATCGIVAQNDAAPDSEQMAAAGNASEADEMATQQHAAQRGHLRLVTSQHVTMPEIEAMRRLARTMGVPYVRMPAHLSRSCRNILPAAVASELRAVPIGRTRGMLTVAMQDPTDADALQRLRALIGLRIFPVLAAPDEIDRALRQLMSK